jgi:hypothetical protein
MVAPAFLIGFEPVETLVDGDVQHVYRHLGLTQRLVYPSVDGRANLLHI